MDAATPRLARLLPLMLLVVAAAAVYQGYHAWIALAPDDTNHLETPLVLAAARQLTEGPGVLYGPFDGRRPLVLCHAPLYYRLTGLLAWPTHRGGLDAVTAALGAGRLLSLAAFLATLVLVWKLATLDGAPWHAGAIGAGLVASSAVFGSTPVTVRPDTLGVALQTLGLLVVLREWLEPCPAAWKRLVPAYTAFAVAACVKQHDVVLAAVSSLLLAVAWWRGRARAGGILAAHAVAFAILAGYYGLEQQVTGGRMFESAFRLPAAFGEVAPAGWGHVGVVLLEVAKRSVGMLALAAVAAAALGSGASRLRRLDVALLLALAAEVAATALLCKGSEGAWVNYAMQPVLLAAVLLARVLGQIGLDPWPARAWVLAGGAGAAALGLLLADARLSMTSWLNRRDDRAAVAALMGDAEIRASAPGGVYFVAAPDHNRLHGRPDLAHDEWLYAAFEALDAAEPRGRWLAGALASGGVRFVVEPFVAGRSSGGVPGVPLSLAGLGFRVRDRYERFLVWERADAISRGDATRQR